MLPCDIVFSDLDGTLLDADHRLTARTIAAVAALRRAGVPFVPASARGPSGVMPICRALDLGPGPMVACGGALVYGAAGECLASTGMTVEAAAQAQALCAAHGAAACLYAGADWLAPDPEDPRVRREEEIVCARARRGGAQRGLDGLDVPPGLGRRAAKAGTEHDHASPPLKILQRKSAGFHRKTGKTHAKESAVPPFFQKGCAQKIPCRRLVRPQHGFCPKGRKKTALGTVCVGQGRSSGSGLVAPAASPSHADRTVARWAAGTPPLRRRSRAGLAPASLFSRPA